VFVPVRFAPVQHSRIAALGVGLRAVRAIKASPTSERFQAMIADRAPVAVQKYTVRGYVVEVTHGRNSETECFPRVS
jgi:hypothetical protein